MSIHQCPKCELRFNWKTELDDHCWHDHPQFRHEYPAGVAPPPAAEPTLVTEPSAAPRARTPRQAGEAFVRWLVPRQVIDQRRARQAAAEPPTRETPDPRQAAQPPEE